MLHEFWADSLPTSLLYISILLSYGTVSSIGLMGQNCKPYMVLWYLLSIHSSSNPNADILVTSLVLKHCAHALRQPRDYYFNFRYHQHKAPKHQSLQHGERRKLDDGPGAEPDDGEEVCPGRNARPRWRSADAQVGAGSGGGAVVKRDIHTPSISVQNNED